MTLSANRDLGDDRAPESHAGGQSVVVEVIAGVVMQRALGRRTVSKPDIGARHLGGEKAKSSPAVEGGKAVSTPPALTDWAAASAIAVAAGSFTTGGMRRMNW